MVRGQTAEVAGAEVEAGGDMGAVARPPIAPTIPTEEGEEGVDR